MQVETAVACQDAPVAERDARRLTATPIAIGTLIRKASSKPTAKSGRANGQINDSGRCCPEIRGHKRNPPTLQNSAKAPAKAAKPASALRRATDLTGGSLPGACSRGD
jgi:hypothetical protein